MNIVCNVVEGKNSSKFKISVGDGKQHVRWLGLVASKRYQKEVYPHAFRIPQRILNSEGLVLRPRAPIADEFQDGDEATIELRQGAFVSEEVMEHDDMIWIDEVSLMK